MTRALFTGTVQRRRGVGARTRPTDGPSSLCECVCWERVYYGAVGGAGWDKDQVHLSHHTTVSRAQRVTPGVSVAPVAMTVSAPPPWETSGSEPCQRGFRGYRTPTTVLAASHKG